MSANPTTYIVPSAVVARVLVETHQGWLALPGKRGQQRNETELRRFMPDYTINCGPATPYPQGWLEQYRDAWRLLA